MSLQRSKKRFAKRWRNECGLYYHWIDTDEFAFGNIADQDDLRLQSQNGAQVKVQPRLVPRRACDAVERNARAHAVALKLGIIQQAIL